MPSILLDALVERARSADLSNVSVVHLHVEGPGPHLALTCLGTYVTGPSSSAWNARRAVEEDRADYVPVFLSDVPHLFTSGVLHLDAVLINATPPDGHGFVPSARRWRPSMQRSAPPRRSSSSSTGPCPALGESFIHVDEIDLAVEVDVPPYEHPVGELGYVERRIGAYVAEPIPDRATLQLGIEPSPRRPRSSSGTSTTSGIHTEMFTDSVVDLVEAVP